jgi:hypothetical protein
MMEDCFAAAVHCDPHIQWADVLNDLGIDPEKVNPLNA